MPGMTITLDGKAYRLEGELKAVPVNGNGEDPPPPIDPPVANAGGPYEAKVGDDVQFSSDGSSGDGLQYLWEFGDDNSSTDANPVHAYEEAGSFAATLTVTDEHGVSDSATADVVITADDPVDPPPPPPPNGDKIEPGPDQPEPGSHTEPVPYAAIEADPQAIIVEDGEVLEVNDRLEFTTLLIRPHGELRLLPGAELVVIGELDRRNPDDPFQHQIGIINEGWWVARGTPKTSGWVESVTDVMAGGTSIELATAPEGWNVGDELILPATRQQPIGQSYSSQSEVVEITAVEGSTVSFTPARFNHVGATVDDVRLPFDVGNLTRDIVIRAEDHAQPGHTISLKGSVTHLEHVAFESMGRTTSWSLNNTFVSGDTVLHYGRNPIGKYAVHDHDAASSYFVIRGCSFRHSRKWAIAIHSSHDAVVTHNVIYDTQGAGIMFEEGNERGALVENNFVVGAQRRGPDSNSGTRRFNQSLETGGSREILDYGWTNSGIYFRRVLTDSVVRNNRVADVSVGYLWNGYYAGGLVDAEPAMFEDNRVYSSRFAIYSAHSRTLSFHRRTIDRLIAWNVQQGTRTYWSENWTYRDSKIFADPTASSNNEAKWNLAGVGIGVYLGNPTYRNRDMEILGCDIRGFNIGIVSPMNHDGGDRRFDVEGTILSNFVNVEVGRSGQSRTVHLDNLTFIPSDMSRAGHRGTHLPDDETDIWMSNRLATHGNADNADNRVVWDGDRRVWRRSDAPCQEEVDRVIGFVCPVEE